MRFVAWRGPSQSYRRAVEGHSPWTRDADDPHPVTIANIDSADLDESLRMTVKAEGIGALAFIPVVAKGTLVGKLMTYYPAAHHFTDAEIELAVTIGRQLGFSIERMRTEEANRWLAAIIENSTDSIVSKDLGGIVTSWNRGAERRYGYVAAEMIGKPLDLLVPPDRRAQENSPWRGARPVRNAAPVQGRVSY
jgi:GAF domain-containing protein